MEEGGGWGGGEEQQVEGRGGMGGVRDVFKTLSCSSSTSIHRHRLLSLHLTKRPALVLHSGKELRQEDAGNRFKHLCLYISQITWTLKS